METGLLKVRFAFRAKGVRLSFHQDAILDQQS